MLKHRELPEYLWVRPTWVNEKTHQLDAITPEEILSWVKQIFNSHEVNNDNVIGWDQISLDTNRCLLPGSIENINNDKIVISNANNQDVYHLPVEIENELVWVYGPISPQTLNAPIEVSLSKEYGEITLDMFLHWSIYTEEGSPGRQKVQANVNKLLTQGWVMDED